MRRDSLILLVLLMLPACFGPVPLQGPQLETALTGRTVMYRDADPARAVPRLHQRWNGDGTVMVDRSPLLMPERVWQDRRWWWVEGQRYCETDEQAERGQVLPFGRCQRVFRQDDGQRLVFETERNDLIADLMFPRIGWSGVYVDGQIGP